MLRADRAGSWVRPGRNGNASAARWRRVDTQRDQAMDYERLDRRRCDWMGEGRWGYHPVPRREGNAGILDPRFPWKMFDAGMHAPGIAFQGRATSGKTASAGPDRP